MAKEVIATDKAPAAIGPYVQATKLGDLVFTSGQIPLDPATMDIVAGGIEAQAEQVMKNLVAVLKAAGADTSTRSRSRGRTAAVATSPRRECRGPTPCRNRACPPTPERWSCRPAAGSRSRRRTASARGCSAGSGGTACKIPRGSRAACSRASSTGRPSTVPAARSSRSAPRRTFEPRAAG